VPKRHVPDKGSPALAAFIPAYATASGSGGKKKGVKGAGNTFGQGGKGDVGELSPTSGAGDPGEHSSKIKESMQKRNEMLRQATWMWQRGNANNRGGEVAMYFAERVGVVLFFLSLLWGVLRFRCCCIVEGERISGGREEGGVGCC
jgi:hypothetical protein